MRYCFIIFIAVFCTSAAVSAQAWHWAKKPLIIEGISTSPLKTCIDSRSNTILLSGKLDRQIISKHDVNGNLLWKRELFFSGSNSHLSPICVDEFDDIYIVTTGISKIDGVTVNTSPFSIIKFSSNGRFIWSRRIEYTQAPLTFAPRLISSGNRIFLTLTIPQFATLTYQSVAYNNIGNNTYCSFVASLDTTGNVKWSNRIYSPAQPISCTVRDAFPQMTVNENKELLLVGDVTDKLMVESTPVINYPFNCRHFTYAMVINGNTGAVKWARELILDTLAPKPNLTILNPTTLATILSNGYSVVYRYITQDTAIATPASHTVNISDKIYLYDAAGNLIRKDSLGRKDTGWYEMDQIYIGKGTTFYSSGVNNGNNPNTNTWATTYEARKWDTLFAPVWKKNTVYSRNFPYYTSNQFHYRDGALSMILQAGSGSSNGMYAYFGADSSFPNLDFIFARMLDSANFISGIVFFDLNRNGKKDNNEPIAPNVLIGNNSGDTVYTVTRPNGFFEMPAGIRTYNFKPLNLAASYPFYTSCLPASYFVSFTGYGNYILNKNFALSPATTVTDGQINITRHNPARPGGILRYTVSASNTGATNLTGVYKITYDTSRVTFVSSSLTPSVSSPPTLTYLVSMLTPLASLLNDIHFRIKPTALLNDTIKIKADLTVSPADALVVNNTDSVFAVIRSSFDPNLKEVYPFKEARYDSVIAGRQELDYTIYFQNTGNDTAFAVRLLDTLDSKLDLSTFHIISSSHPVTITWTSPNIAGFYFPNILLPDSDNDEINSHGFVRFRIRPKTNVLLADIVKNNASIYFDYNSPVKTNTVNTSFIRPVITAVGNNNFSTKGLFIRSNPVHDNLYFKVVTSNIHEQMVVSIYDESGRIVMNTVRLVVTNTEQAINVSRLAKGLYYFELKGKNKNFLKKIVVQ